MAKVDPNCLNFEMWFIRSEIVRINWRKFDTMMNKKCKATTSIIIRTVAPKQRIVREGWICSSRLQLSLLNTRNFDVVIREERGEFALACLYSICVEL